jgi:UDP-N-acetylmuramoylalanine--D-glutamate ligase
VIKSLEGFDTSVVLIAGGLDKEGDFRSLRAIVSKRVKALVFIGAAAKKIEDALGDLAPAEHARDMNEAVQKSQAFAKSGDVVLLSPGCASFDMFRDYGHRGDVFQEAVRGLK